MAKSIKNIITDTDRKSFLEITRDLTGLLIKYKSFNSLGFYATNLMYKKNSGNINNYLPSEKLMRIINNYYRKDGEDPILQNKVVFSEYLRKNKIPTTGYIGKIERKKFYLNKREILLENNHQVKEVIQDVLKVYPSVFIKQVDSEGGKGVFKIEKKNINDIDNIILENNYIIEESLTQHEEIARINPYCINTLRVITFREGNKVYFPSCFFRMGVGTSFIDNGSSGGIFINYDIHTNKLGKVAYNLFENGGKSYYKHPGTGYEFNGKSLIFSEEIKNILSNASLLFNRQMIGWDIAYTPDKPVIIEANDNPHVRMMQITSKGLNANPIYKKIFADI